MTAPGAPSCPPWMRLRAEPDRVQLLVVVVPDGPVLAPWERLKERVRQERAQGGLLVSPHLVHVTAPSLWLASFADGVPALTMAVGQGEPASGWVGGTAELLGTTPSRDGRLGVEVRDWIERLAAGKAPVRAAARRGSLLATALALAELVRPLRSALAIEAVDG